MLWASITWEFQFPYMQRNTILFCAGSGSCVVAIYIVVFLAIHPHIHVGSQESRTNTLCVNGKPQIVLPIMSSGGEEINMLNTFFFWKEKHLNEVLSLACIKPVSIMLFVSTAPGSQCTVPFLEPNPFAFPLLGGLKAFLCICCCWSAPEECCSQAQHARFSVQYMPILEMRQ